MGKAKATASATGEAARRGARPRLVAARRLMDRLSGARLCYGKPVVVGERTVIPVARVRTAGGFGFGDNESAEGIGGGGGGGGYVEASPIGFIDVGPEGSRFQPIEDPEATIRALRAGAAALATLATTVVGVRAARAGRSRDARSLPSPRRLLQR